MDNLFNFRPVGQGLFYTGSILNGDYNFVFDCGTENKRCYLEREITKFRAECVKPELQFVVLSHLHVDHYSGLEELMKNFKIKTIYLPYLGANRNLTELVLAYSTFIRETTEEDFERKYSLFYLMQNLYDEKSDIIPGRVFVGGASSASEKHSFFTYSYYNFEVKNGGLPYWQFILLNKKYNDSIMAHLDREVDALLKKYEVDSVRALVDNHQIEEIKKMYEKVFGRHNRLNLTSTMLVHYNICKDLKCVSYQYSRSFRSEIGVLPHASLSLLTGDAEADRWEVAKLMSILKCRTGVLQVPHHGSYPNWESLDTVRDKFKLLVIPAGLGNGHRLPSIQTVDDILLEREANLFNVNQDTGFTYFFL